jgi:acyl carrier protein
VFLRSEFILPVWDIAVNELNCIRRLLATAPTKKSIIWRIEMADVFSEVQAIIVDLLGVEESKVTPEARFREDLEADSLDIVELIMAMEDKFGGEISDEDAQKLTNVGEVVDYIQKKMM